MAGSRSVDVCGAASPNRFRTNVIPSEARDLKGRHAGIFTGTPLRFLGRFAPSE
jgi:hypothetical protein